MTDGINLSRDIQQDTLSKISDLARKEAFNSYNSLGVMTEVIKTDFLLWEEGFKGIPGFPQTELGDVIDPLASMLVNCSCIHIMACHEEEVLKSTPLERSERDLLITEIPKDFYGRITLAGLNTLYQGLWSNISPVNPILTKAEIFKVISYVASGLSELATECNRLGYGRNYLVGKPKVEDIQERRRVLYGVIQRSESLAYMTRSLHQTLTFSFLDINKKCCKFIDKRQKMLELFK